MNKENEEKQFTIKMLKQLNRLLRDAHYWLTERDAPEQAADAIMEARGLTLRLSEKQGGYIQFPSSNITDHTADD